MTMYYALSNDICQYNAHVFEVRGHDGRICVYVDSYEIQYGSNLKKRSWGNDAHIGKSGLTQKEATMGLKGRVVPAYMQSLQETISWRESFLICVI